MEHAGLLFLFTCQPTKGCNCSRSGVNVRAYLLRNNFSRTFGSIQSWPVYFTNKISYFFTSPITREIKDQQGLIRMWGGGGLGTCNGGK